MRTAPGHLNLAVLSIIAVAAGAPLALCAQAVAPAHWYIERTIHERWITPDQRPEFTPFVDTVSRYQIDSVSDRGGSRSFLVGIDRYRYGRFTQDSTGRVGQFDGGTRGLPPPSTAPGAADRDAKLRLWEDFLHNRIGMPQARVWDVAISFHPASRTAGAGWVDTLNFDTQQAGFRQSLRGVRRSVILRDTLVLGRTMYLTRDSAKVTYLERFLPAELPDPQPRPVIERTTSGTIIGTSIYDPEFRLFFVRHDTTLLSGTATRAYLNDPILRTPISYLRTREWALVDSATVASRVAAQRAAARAAVNRERPPPLTPAARRDSLLAWARRPLAAGDSVAAFGILDSQLDGQILSLSRQIDVEALQLILPMLADRQRAFSRDLDYAGMIYGLNRHLTGAAPAITTDTNRWACVPDACAYLASQWENGRDERLRNLGLITHFVVDPVRWASTLDQRAKVDSELLDGVLALRRGVATTWPAGTHAPMPGAYAEWPMWVEWMNGHDPAYPVLVLPNRPPPPARIDVRFGSTHVAAIQMYQLVSGRNIINEWRQQLAGASDDSAKLVFTTMLTGMHAGQGNPAEIAARLRDSSTIVRSAAVKEVVALFEGVPPPADSVTTREIQDRFLTIALDQALFWPPLPPGPRTGSPRGFIEVEAHRPGDSLFIAGGALAPALRAKWGNRAHVVEDSALRTAMSPFRSTYFRPSAVWQVGPFVKATLDYGFDTPGSSHRAPSAGVFLGSTTVYLMKTNNGWVVVTEQTRIT